MAQTFSKRDKSGRSKRKLGPFVALERYLLASLAWRSLSPVARCALIELLMKYNGINNGRLAMSANNLANLLSISRATAGRALQQLIDVGFIETTRPSGFSCKLKIAAEYRVTFHRCDATGNLPMKQFMRWQPKIRTRSHPSTPTVSPQSNGVEKQLQTVNSLLSHETDRTLANKVTVSPESTI